MSDFTVYGIPGSPYLRSALLGLEEKRADYRLAAMAMGEGKSPAHLARQPFGRIPALDHGDFRLYETQAILRYLDAVLPGAALRPSEPRALGRMDQIVGMVDWYIFPFITVGISAERFMSQVFWGRPADEANIAAALPKAEICVRELARLKGSAPYLAGDAVSIADLMAAPHFAFFAATPEGQGLMADTGLDDWMARMAERASFKATEADRLRAAA